MTQSLKDRSIADFGEQWTRYRDNEGYYGSAEMFADMFAPLLTPEKVAGNHGAGDIFSQQNVLLVMAEFAAADQHTP